MDGWMEWVKWKNRQVVVVVVVQVISIQVIDQINSATMSRLGEEISSKTDSRFHKASSCMDRKYFTIFDLESIKSSIIHSPHDDVACAFVRLCARRTRAISTRKDTGTIFFILYKSGGRINTRRKSREKIGGNNKNKSLFHSEQSRARVSGGQQTSGYLGGLLMVD